jgi:hypothetical protein
MSEKKNSDFEIISSIEMQAEIDQSEEPDQKLLSNIPTLDKAIEGFVQGELIVISGPARV